MDEKVEAQIVFILVVHDKVFQTVLGVYSSEEKAKEIATQLLPTCGWQVSDIFIFKRTVE